MKKAEEKDIAKKLKADLDYAQVLKREQVQKHKEEVARVKIENDRLLKVKEAQKKAEIEADIEARRKFLEMEDEKARKRAEALEAQHKSIEAKMNRGLNYIKVQEDKEEQEELKRQEHQRLYWLKQEEKEKKTKEKMSKQNVEVKNYLVAQMQQKKIKSESEHEVAMREARRLKELAKSGMDQDNKAKEEARLKNIKCRLFIENQMKQHKDDMDVLDVTPVEFQLNSSVIKELEQQSVASETMASSPTRPLSARKFIPSNRGAPSSHFKTHIPTKKEKGKDK
jgi:hypothetical protein